jgi:hypothetical protein
MSHDTKMGVITRHTDPPNSSLTILDEYPHRYLHRHREVLVE